MIAALLISVGIGLSGYFIGNTLYKSSVAMNTATVKGLAERRVQADQVSWNVGFSVEGPDRESIPRLYEEAERSRDKILEYLVKSGIQESEITKGIVNHSTREYRNENQELVEEKHILSGEIIVETTRVEAINDARAEVNKLIVQGISIDNKPPQYHFTKLNDIKPAMLEEATKNARIAADEFAKNADVKVGKIKTARQGGFIVVDVGENYGDTKRIEKDVRVVTTVEFYLSD